MVAGRSVLVIDDEPMVTRSCRRILTDAGYGVGIADTGQDGLSQAVGGDFDLVMADLRLPDLDGMELVRTLHRQRPEIAIIVITGYGSVASAVEAVKLGVSDYIQKPFTPQQITDAIDQALSGSQRQPGPEGAAHRLGGPRLRAAPPGRGKPRPVRPGPQPGRPGGDRLRRHRLDRDRVRAIDRRGECLAATAP